MIAFVRALPILGWFLVGATILASLSYLYHSIKESGRAEVREQIRKANEGLVHESDKAARNPDECDATGGVWSQIAGRCERP